MRRRAGSGAAQCGVDGDLTVQVQQTEPVTVEKIVALYTSRDRAISEVDGRTGEDRRQQRTRCDVGGELDVPAEVVQMDGAHRVTHRGGGQRVGELVHEQGGRQAGREPGRAHQRVLTVQPCLRS